MSQPGPEEELRGWAEIVAEIQYTGALILWKAESFLPGEQLQEAFAAWSQAGDSDSFALMIEILDPAISPSADTQTATSPPTKVKIEDLSKAGLSGPRGIQKRNALRRARDFFHGLFWSEPPTSENQRKASEAAERHLDLGSVALDSLGACADNIPGWSAACKIGQEGALVLKHFLEVRRSRDY